METAYFYNIVFHLTISLLLEQNRSGRGRNPYPLPGKTDASSTSSSGIPVVDWCTLLLCYMWALNVIRQACMPAWQQCIYVRNHCVCAICQHCLSGFKLRWQNFTNSRYTLHIVAIEVWSTAVVFTFHFFPIGDFTEQKWPYVYILNNVPCWFEIIPSKKCKTVYYVVWWNIEKLSEKYSEWSNLFLMTDKRLNMNLEN